MKHLILKTVNADMTSYGGFVWPESGYVEAKDWNNRKECGGGLYGALNCEGDGSLFNWSEDANWIVFEADEYVDLDGKVKAPSANVVYCGDRTGACKYLQDHGCNGAIIGGTASAGHRGTASAGDYGTATAGCRGIAIAGDIGTAIARYRGTAIAGYYGTATAGYYGTAIAGYYGTAIAGCRGIASVGGCGIATAGDYGKASAGYSGTASAGNYSTISIEYYDGRRRIKVGYIGEDGLKANTAYKLDDNHEFVEVKP